MWSLSRRKSENKAALGSGHILSPSVPLSLVFPSPFLSSFPLPSSSLLFLATVSVPLSTQLFLDTAPSLPPLSEFACAVPSPWTVLPPLRLSTILSAPSGSSQVQPFPGSCPPSPKPGVSVPSVSFQVRCCQSFHPSLCIAIV